MSANKKILIYHDPPRQILALIPKLRGEGFLKVPIGHHASAKIQALEDAAKGDVYGLDGHVEIETSAQTGDILADFSIALEKAFGFPAREVGKTEFWEKHPIRSDKRWDPIKYSESK